MLIQFSLRDFKPSFPMLLCSICGMLFIMHSTFALDKTQRILLTSNLVAYTKGTPKMDTVGINKLLKAADEQRYYSSDSLQYFAKRALDKSIEIKYAKGQAVAYSKMGYYYSDTGQHDDAILYFNKAYILSQSLGNNFVVLNVLNDLAGEYGYKGDYAMALRKYLAGIELAAASDDKEMLSILNENLANLYISQKDYEQAMVFYKEVKKINQEINNPRFIAETMSNMASAYADMGELDLAMYNVNSAITLFEKERILDWLAFTYETKGKVYLKQKKYDWAMYWYKQSELLHGKLEDDRGEIALLNGMAEASLGANKDDIAETYASKALALSEKLQFMSGSKDCANILYAYHKNKGHYEQALHFHELYQRLSDTLSRKENKKGLTLLKTKIEYDQQKELLMLQNEKALAKQKMYVYISLLVLSIVLCITLLVRKNEKTQKSLYQKLLAEQLLLEKSEEHLREINKTKTKLFSIIGHDLRGPIGAFQGLIKLFKDGEMSKDEFLTFVPKLKMDIDTIAFTLNNLLSWGQTQMNGTRTNPGVTSLEHIVGDNIGLLSEMALRKSIRLVNAVESNTLTYSDSNQVDIIIRNLLSNAIKFTQENGEVTIGALEKSKYWEIYVRDTGIGMNEETLGKIFKKDAAYSTYGTHDEKGTGLGLSLCKEMVEMNKGIIWVDSKLYKGTSFYFTIPKVTKELKKSA